MSVAAMTLDEKLAAREMLKQQVADLKRKVADLDQQLADQERAAWERALLISARFCVGVKRTSDHSDVRAAAGSRRVSARRCLLWRWLRDMTSVLFLGRRRIKTATSNLGYLGRARPHLRHRCALLSSLRPLNLSAKAGELLRRGCDLATRNPSVPPP